VGSPSQRAAADSPRLAGSDGEHWWRPEEEEESAMKRTSRKGTSRKRTSRNSAPKWQPGDRVIEKRPGGAVGTIISCGTSVKGKCFVKWSDGSTSNRVPEGSLRPYTFSTPNRRRTSRRNPIYVVQNASKSLYKVGKPWMVTCHTRPLKRRWFKTWIQAENYVLDLRRFKGVRARCSLAEVTRDGVMPATTTWLNANGQRRTSRRARRSR
jgi:hypothetical protein